MTLDFLQISWLKKLKIMPNRIKNLEKVAYLIAMSETQTFVTKFQTKNNVNLLQFQGHFYNKFHSE